MFVVAAACLYIILGVHFLLFPLVLNSECNCLSNYCVYSIIWIIFKNILPKNCTWKLASWLTLPYSHKCWSMCCPYKQINKIILIDLFSLHSNMWVYSFVPVLHHLVLGCCGHWTNWKTSHKHHVKTSWVHCGLSGCVHDAIEWGWRTTWEILKTWAARIRTWYWGYKLPAWHHKWFFLFMCMTTKSKTVKVISANPPFHNATVLSEYGVCPSKSKFRHSPAVL